MSLCQQRLPPDRNQPFTIEIFWMDRPDSHRDKNRMKRVLIYPSAYAFSNAPISIFFICSIAIITFCDFLAFLSARNLLKMLGTTCQDSPYLSFNHPHC